jgi:hypothetical protein
MPLNSTARRPPSCRIQRSDSPLFPERPRSFAVGPAAFEVEPVTGAENVEFQVVDRQSFVWGGFSDIGMGDVSSIDQVNCSTTDDFEPMATHDDCSVLVDADSQRPGILRYGPDQAADPSPLGEMLVDDNVWEQSRSWRHAEITNSKRTRV